MFIASPNTYLDEGKYEQLTNLDESSAIVKSAMEHEKRKSIPNGDISQYPRGTIVDSEVVSVQPYGVFVEFGLGGKGLIHISTFKIFGEHSSTVFSDIEVGDSIRAEVIAYSKEHLRFSLKPTIDFAAQSSLFP